MIKHIYDISELPDLFEKLSFKSEKYGSTYTAMVFDVKNKNMMDDFGVFLLKHLRISDSLFVCLENKFLAILEETSVKGALLLNDKLREKIEDKGLKFNFHCAAVQGNFLDDIGILKKTLLRKLKKAVDDDSSECIHSVSILD